MTSSFRGVLTVSRMRVGVDEAGVEYLLGERSDQLIGGLQSEHSMRRFSDPPPTPPLNVSGRVGCTSSRLSNSIPVF